MVNQIPPIVYIQANGLPDAWYKAVKDCMSRGAVNWRERSKPVRAKNIVSIIEAGNPLQNPMLHDEFPMKELQQDYIKQWERGYKWKEHGHMYNCMDRLINYPITQIDSRCDGYFKVPRKPFTQTIDQIKILSENLAERIKKACNNGEECLVNNLDLAISWVPERDLFLSEDQLCLQSVQIFVYSYPKIVITEQKKIIAQGKGEFLVTWKSQDLYSNLNSNMVGLTLMLNKEIFEPNNIKIARCVDICRSAYIYETDWEAASKIKPMNIELHTSGSAYEE